MIKSLLLNEVSQDDVLNYYNANISYEDLSRDINGFVFNYRGINNIIINKNLSYYKKRKTIIHELAHIELSQLEQSNKDIFAFYIDKYEDDANLYIKNIFKEIKEC